MRLTRLALFGITIAAVVFSQQFPAPPDPQAPVDQGDAAPDEPGRPVARISVLSGDASVRRGDSGDWVAGAVNAPLMAADSISVASGGTAEIQLDYANFLRVAGDSEIRLANLDNNRYQLQLSRGLITYRVLRQGNAQTEISTPLVAVRPAGLSAVRVEAAPDGSTRVTVRHGEVEVATAKGTERIREGNMMTVRGDPNDPEFQDVYAPAPDQWDTWNDQRDTYLSRAQSPRYVSQDVYGAEDLDNYGRWSYDPAYGNVWAPNVPATWAPYRNGQWVWEDYYGWTWVDYDPWGWAPFHYGSWYYRTGFGWSWFPGARYHHYWWRPALVGFVGFGSGFGVGFGFGNVGWVPLAPYERFHPWYGRGWWGGGRNTVFNNINIVHNTNITNIYRNSRFANGVTAVTAADFQRGNFRSPVAIDRAQLQQASLVRGAVPMTPNGSHLAFTNRAAVTAGPRGNFSNQRFFSRMTPSGGVAQRTPFAQQQAAVRSAFERRGFQTEGAGARGTPNNRFAEVPRSPGSFQNPGARQAPAPGWQRFGSGQGSSPERSSGSGMPGRQFGSTAPERSSNAVAPGRQFGSAPSGRPFSAPQQPQQRYAPAPNMGGSRGYYGGGPARPLQVAPPTVRQRETSPSYGGPSYNRGGGFSQPSFRSAPSAPSFRGGGAGRPAPSFRGGGGGGGGHAAPGGGARGGGRR